MHYHEKKREQQFTSVSIHLQAYIIPQDHCGSAFFTAKNVKFLHCVVYFVTTLFELRSILPDALTPKLAAMPEAKSS